MGRIRKNQTRKYYTVSSLTPRHPAFTAPLTASLPRPLRRRIYPCRGPAASFKFLSYQFESNYSSVRILNLSRGSNRSSNLISVQFNVFITFQSEHLPWFDFFFIPLPPSLSPSLPPFPRTHTPPLPHYFNTTRRKLLRRSCINTIP